MINLELLESFRGPNRRWLNVQRLVNGIQAWFQITSQETIVETVGMEVANGPHVLPVQRKILFSIV